MIVAYLVVAGVSVALWLPTLIRFFRTWRDRRNPVSLAICATIMLIMWSAMAGLWVISESLAPLTIILTTTSMSVLVALYVHLAFHWAKKRFPESRDSKSKEPHP